MTEGEEAARQSLDAFDVSDRAHSSDGRNFLQIGFDATLRDQPSNLPLRTPKTHFSGCSLIWNLSRFANVASNVTMRSSALGAFTRCRLCRWRSWIWVGRCPHLLGVGQFGQRNIAACNFGMLRWSSLDQTTL